MTASEKPFAAAVETICLSARAEGVGKRTLHDFLSQLRFDTEVAERERNQPECALATSAYLDRLITDERVLLGARAHAGRQAAFAAIEARFGVDSRVVAAIWGVESSYGANMGEFRVPDALATLFALSKRPGFHLGQLVSALKIAEAGAVPLTEMRGSWAGAMGHTQFMPTTYLEDAVPFAGSGHPDIWGEDPSDALASSAQFLSRRDWRAGCPWGGEIILPEGFDFMASGLHRMEPPSYWQERGIVLADGGSLADWGPGSVLLPAGHAGPAFLAAVNFRALLAYNRATSYALAVGLLADRIAGKPGLSARWPDHRQPLSRREMARLQHRLVDAGHDTGGIDGIAGPKTVMSIQKYQRERGQVPDGFASRDLLN